MPILAARIFVHLPVCQLAEVSSGTFAQADPISSLLDSDLVSMQANASRLHLTFEARC